MPEAPRVRLTELLGDAAHLEALAAALREGAVAAIPTETFYGLAASPWSARGCARVFAIKGRNAEKALPVLAAAVGELALLGIESAPEDLAAIAALWPAPLTAVFAARVALPCTGGERSIAVRVPAHDDLRRLLAAVGPVTGTSANRAGEPALATADAVATLAGAEIDLLIDGGATPGGLPSTIVDARERPPRVLRRGAFPWNESG